MTILKRAGVFLAAWVMIGGFTEFSERLNVVGLPSLVSSAEAVVGRPLTPVSVAGVARRTTRRCAVGVYNC
jgi:hypothetical protein